MIKGINHTIIELNDTGNEYYERALLIVKPEYASVQRTILEQEAKKMLRELDAPSAIRFHKHRLKTAALLLCAGAAGGMLTMLINSLCSIA